MGKIMEFEPIKRLIAITGSQKKLAEIIGVSQPTICKWLNGKAKPDAEKVPALVRASNGYVLANELRPDLPDLFPPCCDVISGRCLVHTTDVRG